MTPVTEMSSADQQRIERLSEGALSGTRSEGVRKAAILLLTLDGGVASKVFKCLPEDEIELISQEITKIGMVQKEEMVGVLEEFRDLITVQGFVREGGYDSAIQLIRESLPKGQAQKMVRLLEAQRQSVPFHFLENAESEVLGTFLQEEHPQTIALVLSYMEANKAAGILTSLPHNIFVVGNELKTMPHKLPGGENTIFVGRI